MKIERLVLEGFIGIWDGLGQTRFEFNLPKGNTNSICLLVGANGKGKSVMVSHMSPFFEAFDGRPEQIIEGRDEAYKEVVIRDGEDLYIAEHHWNKGKVKSFFSKNGEQLNPKGGVRTFAVAVAENLGIDPEFVRVGKLGTSSNFADLNSSDRKRFIANFVPDITPYQEINKQTSAKLTKIKSVIRFLADELSKLDSKDAIDAHVASINKALGEAREQLSSESANLKAVDDRLQQLETEMQEKGVDSGIVSDLEDLNSSAELVTAKIKKMTDENPKLLDYYDCLADQIRSIEDFLLKAELDFSSITREEGSLSAAIDQSHSEIESKSKQLEELCENVKTAEDLRQQVAEARSTRKELAVKFQPLDQKFSSDFADYNSSQLVAVRSSLSRIKEQGTALFESTSEPVYNELLSLSNEKSYESLVAHLNQSASEYRNFLQKAEDLVSQKSQEIGTINSNASNLDVLELRPSNCNIDSCGFIRTALQAQKALERLPVLEQAVDEKGEEVKSLTEKLENVVCQMQILNTISSLARQISRDESLQKFEIVACSDPLTLLHSLLDQSVSNSMFSIPDNLTEYVYCLENLDLLTKRVKDFDDQIKLLEVSESFVDSIEKEIEKLESAKQEAEEKIEQVREEKTAITNKIERKELALELLKLFESRIAKLETHNTKIASLEELLAASKHLLNERNEKRGDKKTLTNQCAGLTLRVNELENESSQAQLRQLRFEEYTEKFNDLNVVYEQLILVKEASDTVKGIPVELIDEYLTSISDSANNLLDIAYRGGFSLNFKINEKELLIPVKKPNGSVAKDIKAVSQGQRAMVKTTLSLAILKRVFRNFNIISLDEIDAELDKQNRRAFLDILEAQVQELGLEQVFVISHNQEFLSKKGLNLILFPEHTAPVDTREFMDGKEIIADYS